MAPCCLAKADILVKIVVPMLGSFDVIIIIPSNIRFKKYFYRMLDLLKICYNFDIDLIINYKKF
jgi:hypothetical protein